jgi:hypothetical protein
MSVPVDVHDAVAALVEPALDPVLTDAEIDAAILRSMGYRTWTATTTYLAGVLVTPTVPNGWAYAPHSQSVWTDGDSGYTAGVLPGVSGATEPVWVVPATISNPAAFVADGTITWTAAVPTSGTYDVKAAASECWRTKARKASDRVDTAILGAGSSREATTYERCMDQARLLEPVGLF